MGSLFATRFFCKHVKLFNMQSILLALCLLLCGCGGLSQPPAESAAEAVAEQFAGTLLSGDFKTAEAFTTSNCRERARLAELYAQAEAKFSKPDCFEVDLGELPAATGGSTKTWTFPSDIRLKDMKAWLVCTMANDKGQCFDLWVLIVEEKSDLKVGYFDITAAD